MNDGELQEMYKTYRERLDLIDGLGITRRNSTAISQDIDVCIKSIKEDMCFCGTGEFLNTSVLVINFYTFASVLRERNNQYSEKQASGAATQTMLKLAWDIQELSALNDMGRSMLVECQVLRDKLSDPVYDAIVDNLPRKLASLRGQMTAFMKRISRYCRNPATHLLVIMISTEDRRTKPYALPVQCLSYRSLKDAQIRKIANKVVQAMTKRGMKVAGRGIPSMYVAIHCFYNL